MAQRHLRTRIAAAMAGAALVAITVVAVSVDRTTAIAARDRLRLTALDRLEAAQFAYSATQTARFGATLDQSIAPAGLLRAAAATATVSYFDGRWMWAVGHVESGAPLIVRLDAGALAESRRSLRRGLLVAGPITTAVVAGLGWLAAGRMSRSLRRAARRAELVAAGDHTTRIPVHGNDEVAELSRAVNHMIDQLAARLDVERRFTADVAHELRTPVTALVSAVELLAIPDHADVASGASADKQRVQRQVTRLRRLVEDLLEISRLEMGGEPVDTEPHDLATVVRASIAAGGEAASGCEVAVRSSAVVLVDGSRVERMVANAVGNAFQHGRAPVTVTVDGCSLTVRDAGDGFPPAILARGPQRFGKGAHSTGSGLGMTILQAQGAAMGATVRFENAEPGAVVTITFPTAAGDDGSVR